MIYFWLALVALSFGLTGFFLHAFYFSRRDQVEELLNEVQNIDFRLALKERGIAYAQKEAAKAKALVQTLGKELAQRGGEIETLKNRIQRREDEIRLLQKSASNAPPAAENPKEGIPLWRVHLNNLLGVLDKIEEETAAQTPGLEKSKKNPR
jgi:hypothetical protein